MQQVILQKEIGRFLRTHCNQNQQSWALYTNQIESCLNMNPNTSTGLSPHQILTGNIPQYVCSKRIEQYIPQPHINPTEIKNQAKNELIKPALKIKKELPQTNHHISYRRLGITKNKPYV